MRRVITATLASLAMAGAAHADLAENPKTGDVAASVPGKVQLYTSGAEPRSVATEGTTPAPLLFSADGRVLVVNDYGTSRTLVLDSAGGVKTIPHSGPAYARAVSPDGGTLAVSLAGGKIQLVRLGDLQSIATIDTGVSGVCALQLSPDGKSLLTWGDGGRSSEVRRWDTATGAALGVVLAKGAWYKVRFAGEGGYAMADSGKQVVLVKLSGEAVHQYPGYGLCDVSADGRYAALGKGHDVEVLPIPEGPPVFQVGGVAQGDGRFATPRMELGGSGQLATFWTTRGTTQIWQIVHRSKLAELPRQAYVVFSGSDRTAAVMENGYVDVLSLESGKALTRVDCPHRSPGLNQAQSCLLTRDDRHAFVQWGADEVQRVELPPAGAQGAGPPVRSQP